LTMRTMVTVVALPWDTVRRHPASSRTSTLTTAVAAMRSRGVAVAAVAAVCRPQAAMACSLRCRLRSQEAV
jgi:hypothetical protein